MLLFQLPKINKLQITLFFKIILFFVSVSGAKSYAQMADSLMKKSLPLKLTYELVPSLANCSFYKNNSWLPDAFIYNATCACLKTPDNYEANTIRYYLKKQLDSFPDTLKKMAQANKDRLGAGKMSKRKYNIFIKRNLTGQIYNEHVTAYSLAGCKGCVAKLVIWNYVTTHKIHNVKLLWASIRFFGSCSGRFGRW